MIHNFNNFNNRMILENVSSDQLDDVIESELDDMGIEYYTHKGYYSEKSYKDGVAGDIWGTLYETPVHETDRYCYLLLIDFDGRNIKSLDLPGGGCVFSLNENKIFDAISNMSKMVDCKVMFKSNRICLFLLTDDEIDVNTDELVSLYNDIKHRFRSSHTDFANSTLTKKYDDFIVIYTDAYTYTDRKLKRMLKGLPLENFNVEMNYEFPPGEQPKDYSSGMAQVQTKISRKN